VEITRQLLVARLADVSHATWLVQSIRDNGRTFDDPFDRAARAGSPPPEDLARAEAILEGVLDGRSLEELSANPKHHAHDHDRERALNTVTELERLGLRFEH
jgi:hypothetical protein